MSRRRRGGITRFQVVVGVGVVAGLLLGLGGANWVRQWRSVERRYDAAIAAAAERHSVDAALVKAVVRQESQFDPDAEGLAGEVGLMQVRFDAYKDWAAAHHREADSPTPLHDPELNLEVGTWYLAKAVHKWQAREDGDLLALFQYNAGPTKAAKLAAENQNILLDDVPISSTRAYISNVRKYRQQYQHQGSLSSGHGQREEPNP